MARRAIKEVEGAAFAGQKVAVAYNRHRCLVQHPVRDGEHCYPVRYKPQSGAKVQGYANRLWLTDVSFFVSPSGLRRIQKTGSRTPCCFVVGTVLKSRPSKPRKSDWTEVRFNPFDPGCFYEVSSGQCVRGAKYVRLEKRTIYAMGVEYGEPVTSTRELNPRTGIDHLRVYNPERSSWQGNMGGENFDPPDEDAVIAELVQVWTDHPGAVVLDGTDDWFAPDMARPELFVELFEIEALALWHTGASGKSSSGIVLTQEQYELLNVRYRQLTGLYVEQVPSQRRQGSPSSCGCWDGSAFRVYHDPRVRPGTWEAPE